MQLMPTDSNKKGYKKTELPIVIVGFLVPPMAILLCSKKLAI